MGSYVVKVLFFYQHPECFVSADETMILCYIKWRILDVYLKSFQLLKFLCLDTFHFLEL